MRKFYAAIALCITLIGTLSPVVFSVSLFGNTPKINVEKNVAYAGDDFIETKFQDILTVESTPAQNGYYTIQGNIRYHMTGIASAVPDGTPLNVGVGFLSSFKNGYISNALYQIMGGVLGSAYREAILFDPELRVRKIGSTTFAYEDNVDVPAPGLKDNEFGIINKNIPLVAGNYEAWFLQNNPISSDILSKRLTFTIDQSGNVTNTHIDDSTGANQNGDIKFAFINYPEIFIDETKPREAKITGKFIYKDPAKPTPAPDNAPVNVSWMLSDPTDTGPGEKGKILYTGTVSGSGKINAEIPFEFTINNLDVGKKFEIHLEENVLTTSEGKRLRSAYVPFTAGTPVDNAAIQQQIQQDNAAAAQTEMEKLIESAKSATDSGDSCAFTDITCKFFILILDFILFIPNAIMVIGGLFMDITLGISINPAMYGINGDTLETGLRTAWALIRDFSNIGFIFALFVAAFSLILNKDLMGFQPKKTVVRVIIMALMVNFSFMMCRVIIQTADIFSHIFYNKISVSGESQSGVGDGNVSNGVHGVNISGLVSATGYKSPSTAIVEQVNPQAILLNQGLLGDDTHLNTVQGAALGTAFGAYNGGAWGAAVGMAAGTAGAFNWKTTSFYVLYGTVAVISFFIYLILIYTFVATGIVFLGRVFGLWIGVILSPLAFVSYSIPFIAENPYIGFEKWLNNFVQLAFTTPIFLMFIYIAMSVLKIKESIIPKGLDTSSSIIAVLLAALIPALASMFIILKGKKIATDMAGEVGKLAASATGWATTAALGAATGGTAMLGRQTLGRAGSALANANRGDNSFLGKGMRTMGDKLGAASFDVRKNERAMKGFGKFTEMSGEKIDLGTRGLREGGFKAEGTLSEQYRKRQEHIAKEQEEKLKKEAADALLDAQAKDAQELRERQAKLEAAKKAKEAEEARIAMEAENQGPQAFIDKKEKEKEDLKNQNIQLNVEKLTVENEKTTLSTEKADIENDLSNLESEKTVIEKDIQQLQTAAAAETDPDKKSNIEAQINFQKEDLAKKNTEIDNKKVELQNKNIQIQDRDKTIAEKDKEIKENDDKIKKADAYQNNLSGITSVRDARQKKIELELEALHSQEKTIAEKSKAEMDKKKTEADEVQSELNKLNTKLKNEKDETKKAQIEADIAEKTAERNKKDTEYNKAKSDHKAAKQRYDDAFGNKITALSDFEKEALKTYEQDHEVQIRKATAQNAVIAAQKDVNASQNNLDNLNYQYQQKYAEDLEKKAAAYQKVFGRMTEHIATATGGLIGGEALNNAGENAATSVRKDVTGK